MRGRLHQLKNELMLECACQRGEVTLCIITVPCTYSRKLIRTALVDKMCSWGIVLVAQSAL